MLPLTVIRFAVVYSLLVMEAVSDVFRLRQGSEDSKHVLMGGIPSPDHVVRSVASIVSPQALPFDWDQVSLRNKMIEKVVRVIDLVPGTVRAMRTVEAASLTAHRFLKEFVNCREPVLIKGELQAWPAFKAWQVPGYLESRCGEQQVQLRCTFNANPYFRSKRELRSLVDCIRDMRGAWDASAYSVPALAGSALWQDGMGSFLFCSGRDDLTPRPYSLYGRRRLPYESTRLPAAPNRLAMSSRAPVTLLRVRRRGGDPQLPRHYRLSTYARGARPATRAPMAIPH